MGCINIKLEIERNNNIFHNILNQKAEEKIAEIYELKLSTIIEEIKKEGGLITIYINKNETTISFKGFSSVLENKIVHLLSQK